MRKHLGKLDTYLRGVIQSCGGVQILLCFRDVISGDTLLNCLFLDDDGQSSPNPANYFQLNRLQINLVDHLHITGRPYKWAQALAGLSFSSYKQPNANGDDIQESVS